MVFYAYSKSIKDDVHWRYLITAPSLEVMDEWYRAMQKALPTGVITRQSPEFYVHDPSRVDLGRCTWTGHNIVPEFMNRMTFALLNNVDGPLYLPFYNGHVCDHRSGKCFYIRSKSDPSVFWFADANGIHAATGKRSRFRITGRDTDKDTVLVRGDSISISPVDHRDRFVSVAGDGLLTLDWRGDDFKFGEFKYGFASDDWEGRARVRRVNDDGEEWELVS
ncbi:hypothetical protein BDV23DRAFT_163520 [Aspergillus alliaceus]|uniref:Uncharacterized protein n=1 Tax=Petromyces alliaceus TaxID=209559 RepID=A0A5N7BXR9_PETAA|nr:uncharacterized protein BDW43DRAFT_312615 [Aspergillus alliaceus]KAB8231999.1 hypothetical protein BDW43DRAFT_312615 [Aspergillus alliaceus]KAE8386307.1 hypothetical protein BDV23DRAFT_163520 [Aspergillus alliaceus]